MPPKTVQVNPKARAVRLNPSLTSPLKFREFTFYELRRAEDEARSPSPIHKFCLCTVRVGDAY